MTRILIILAIFCAGFATPAHAQQSDAAGQPGADAPSPKGDAKKDLFRSILRGVVKTVVEEAQEKEPAVAAPAAPQTADPNPPLSAGTPPVVQPVPAVAPAPQPPPPAAEPASPPAPVVTLQTEPAPVTDPVPAKVTPAVAPPLPVATTIVAIAPSKPASTHPAPAAPAVVAATVERRPTVPWLLALLAVLAAGVAYTATQRARLARTRRLLSIEPRLDCSSSKPAVSPLSFASPPVVIRARLEVAHGSV